MNNQSPLIPQGSLLDQRNKGRARVKIAVFLVLAIHGVGLMALLMQGCKRESDNTTNTAATNDVANAVAPAFSEPTNTLATPTNGSLATTSTTATPTPPPVEPPVTPPPSPAADYTIVKGDTFSTIAKKFHVTAKALEAANPSVEPTKLKIGQSIHIPPASTTTASTASAAATTADATGSGQIYSVKSGDSLTKIANEFGVSIKALRSANNLKTDKIVVGQKLTIPGKGATGTNTTVTPTAGTGQ